MNRMIRIATLVSACGLALPAMAQPTITSLGNASPTKVTNSQAGTISIGGSSGTAAARWTLSGNALALTIAGGSSAGIMSGDGAYMTGAFPNAAPQPRISGNTATGVAAAFSLTPTLIASATSPSATELYGARWNALTSAWQLLPGLPGTGTSPADMVARALYVFGSGSTGGGGTFLNPNAISSNGRFIVGQGYISTYNSTAGTTISASTFQWRGWIWDANTSTMTVLPTPHRTSTNTYRFRTANPYAVSADGLVVVGATEHNVGTSAAADPDGGRLVVWRYDTGTSMWAMSYLPMGLTATGLVQTLSSTVGSVHMNPAGTIIVGKSLTTETATEPSQVFLAKWIWNPVTSTWNNPINIGTNLTTDASWLPLAVTSCGANQPRANPSLEITGMSDDGNTVVGFATYSTCGSFQRGGFIWTNSDDGIMDWYDYNVALGTPGITTSYGPIGDLGDPTKGMPRAGNPLGISPDGNIIVGSQGGTQIIIDAPRWVMQRSNGAANCVPAAASASPAATAVFARCSTFPTSNSVRLTATPSGTLPIAYQWNKNGVAVVDGPTGTGSTVSGATTFEFRITTPSPLDAGNYTCSFTGCDGASVTTAACAVSADTTTPPVPNQSPATALPALLGATTFNACGAYLNDGFAACTATGVDFAPVWYRFVPTFTGTARVQTCASTFDTTLSAYTADLGLIECNNDVGSRGLVGTTCSSTRSLLSRIAVTTGVPIYLRVSAAGVATATGVMTITQNPAAPPANDQCENAQAIGIGSFPFNLSEATDGLTLGTDGCSGAGGSASNRDVFYSISAPFGANITLDTCGPTTNMSNPMLHIYDACGGTVLACNDSFAGTGCTGGSQQARISNFVFTGSVIVRVSASGTGAPNNGGIGTLNISGSIIAPCSVADIVGAGGASDLPPGDGILDGSDFTAFINAFSADDLLADINRDGVVDGGDFIAFINAFGAGC